MSDITPSPKTKKTSSSQMALVGILAGLFVLVLLFFVVRPMLGGGDSAAPPASTPAPSFEVAPDAPAAELPDAESKDSDGRESTPPPSRGRNPFDPPR